MELRQRVRAAAAGALRGSHRTEDPDGVATVGFWLCEGLKKRHVRGPRAQSLETLLREWGLAAALDDPERHFLNEATGVVVPRGDDIGKYVSDKDVVRMCTSDELPGLLEKFATRDAEAAELMTPSKTHTPLEAAISKLKRIGAANPTIKMIQKTFEDTQQPLDEEAELLERFPEIDPIFESGDVVEVPTASGQKCDVCEVSWPDETGSNMYRHKRLDIITHHGCAQFAADVLAQRPEISTRAAFLGLNGTPQNRPGAFHVTVQRAMDLPGLQLLGTQAPYAKLSLLPWKEPIQTQPAENGGRNPMWKSMHDNMMVFSHMYNSTITPIPLLEVEIWNSNYLADDLVACTLLDMTPLLRYPNIEIKRWFALSSRVQAPLGFIGNNNVTTQPRILLTIKFVPLEGKYTTGNEHKFRVHQLKSVGLAIPVCAACDRVIVNVLKGVWGYRCENCRIDVHKACIMKAMSKCECKRARSNSTDSAMGDSKRPTVHGDELIEEHPPVYLKHEGISFRVVNDDVVNEVGQLFVKFDGLHLCTKQCQQETHLHAKNIFEGDTYCRISIDRVIYETSPVLKSADPMYMEKICIKIRRRDAIFKVEVIDFNTDTAIAELNITLFQLLQQAADRFVHGNPFLQQFRAPLRKFSLESNSECESANNLFEIQSNEERFQLLPPPDKKAAAGNKKKLGYALLELDYEESKRDLLRARLDDELLVTSREDKEFSVESLKATIDRLGRTLKKFQWIDAEYADIISWKNKKKSSVCFVFFVVGCVYIDLEYFVSYVLFGVLAYMLYQLHLRLEGEFERRWIGFMDYDQKQADRLKLHRPVADLFVAVHEASLSEATDTMLTTSQALLKDASSSKSYFFVRMTYIPNDKRRAGETQFIPSPFTESIIGWTHAVERSRSPSWRKPVAITSSNGTHQTLAPPQQKQKKEYPYRNFNTSWRHNASKCDCDRCLSWRSTNSNDGFGVVQDSCGIDHHSLYFPVPQACRKNFSCRDDLAPWKIFPGLLKFELCLSLSAEAREVPDFIVASGCIRLRDVRSKADSTHELVVPLVRNLVPGTANVSSPTAPSLADVELDHVDTLSVRVELCTAETREVAHRGSGCGDMFPVGTKALSSATSRSKKTVTTAERTHSEFVCESMIEKEKASVLGQHLFDALAKVKETVTTLQAEIGQACGMIASVENLFNWTHPWKTALVFVATLFAALVLSFIKGRWIILAVGLSEFGAVFLDDLPPSDQFRQFLTNLLSSLPNDQDLIDIYEVERQVYLEQKRGENERTARDIVLLRHHALWAGPAMSKGDNDRNYKSCFLVYRPYRFVLWKSAEDAEVGNPPLVQLVFERMESIVHSHKIDEKAFIFHVFGTASTGADEKRSFSFESEQAKAELLAIVEKSCELRL